MKTNANTKCVESQTFINEFPINEELLDRKAAREALGSIGDTLFYRILNSGQITAVKLGKRLMIKRSEINRYIAELPAYETDNTANT